ncbi:DUF922 domain-containing protein [Pontibacter harenae]|uniref:DUF922 domain-containing protein n=1 Tax=Pontibacter harenae TaxID=2894083 RepID=UPI001E64125F|nr:DUF922 domain-containing protein [Pontibacter harenae]MCC9165561.1 DUF922 domain-containing Zn-dependent protease [Pontibacter harenae]
MFIFSLLLSLVVGIATPAFAPPPARIVKAVVNGSKLDNNTSQLSWSTSRRLTWEDFQGLPDDKNPHHALTAANLAVDVKCKNNLFLYEVKCVFLPTESWSKNKNSERLLAHEQLHFDLTEVHARQLRKKLQEIGKTCGTLQPTLNNAINAAFEAWKAEQDEFDKLSRHGLEASVQEEWTTSIEARLTNLEAYKTL